MVKCQTRKETVKLKTLLTAETVKRHGMQKVARLVSLAHMNKIHQRAKLGRMVLAIKEVKTVKRKNSGQTSSIGLFATELRSC